MTPRRPYTRHGLTAPMVKVKLAGFGAIDRRTAAARETLAFKNELIAALGGEAGLSPQRRKLIDLASRASLLLDHVDAWLCQQRSLVNARAKTLLPVLVQRQAIADHLTRLLDKLGLDRVVKPIDLASYYADAKPVDAQLDEPVVNVEAARQPDMDADESDVEADADADDDADDLEPEPVVSEVVRQPVRRTQVGKEPTSHE